MFFRYYTNAMSHASRTVASWIFVVALLLIGFGVVILAFPEIFAFLAAAIFFIAGFGCAVTAIKIFLMQRRLGKFNSNDSTAYRKNVQIREEYHDL